MPERPVVYAKSAGLALTDPRAYESCADDCFGRIMTLL